MIASPIASSIWLAAAAALLVLAIATPPRGFATAAVAQPKPRMYEPVLLHEVTPHSWMLKQLRIQANGLCLGGAH